MERSEDEERKVVYRGISSSMKVPYENESFAELLSKIESEKKDGLVNIVISDREVGTLRIEGGKVYLNEIVDQTPQELELLKKYPVFGRIALRAMMEKYVDTIADDSIEDTAFLNKIRGDPENRKVDSQHFILLIWDRYWNVTSRFRGDSKDGIYVESERNVWDENDGNSFSSST
ncbi:MAG: hypothetical protein M1290_04830 [Candidatus Thermoplasmatota archaeon]|jgi:hypothetical protein|nr:hypothetical protein [Candidatus Thermoplasmatota archaeon]MCL5789771.1 hypothetical protein [Candidatus Thermoplasmatota archaeon]